MLFLVTTGVMLPYIDRVGRRKLLLLGSVICMVIHFIIAGVMARKGQSVSNVNGNYNLTWSITGSSGMAVIAFSYIFTSVYGFTWVCTFPAPQHLRVIRQTNNHPKIQAPAAWIYASEVFPLKYRAKGVGLSASANWIFNFALAYFVAPAFHNIQWKTYIIFGVFCCVMTFHVFFTYPETAGRSLEEIDMVFDSDVKPWRTNLIHDRVGEEVVKHTEAGAVKEGSGATHEEVV